MRRLACLGSTRPAARPIPLLALAPLIATAALLAGCTGAANFLDDTHSLSLHVNRPIGNSEVLRAVDGRRMDVAPLVAEAGNVWPGPVKPVPTLEEVGRLPVPTLDGAAVPARSSVPNLIVPVIPHHLQPRPGEDGGALTGPLVGGGLPPVGATLPAPQGPTGKVSHNADGQVIDTSRPSGIPHPGAGPAPSGVTVPNGDGTSTVIEPDGTIRTIPSPRK